MKYAICTAILALSAFAASTGATTASPVATAPQTTAPSSLVSAPQQSPLPKAAPTLLAQSLPSCGNYDGQYCAVPGATLRCQWQIYEPGRCRCNSANVWVCG